MKQEMKRVNKFGVILALNKIEERIEKRVVFVHAAAFESGKIFSLRAKFCCSRAAFKSSFLQLLRLGILIILIFY